MSLESDLPVVSDDPWMNHMAYRLMGTEHIRRYLFESFSSRSTGNRLKILRLATQRRFAILDELAFKKPDGSKYQPGCDWMSMTELVDSLSLRVNDQFMTDLTALWGMGYLQARWELGELPFNWTPSVVLIRLREGILKDERMRRFGSHRIVEDVAKASKLTPLTVFQRIRSCAHVRYMLTLTPAGYQLVNPNG